MKYFLTLCFSIIWSFQIFGQNSPSPIIFIYDGSGSMWAQMEGKTRKEIAAHVLTQTVDKLPDDQKIGLIAYGHRQKGDCRDVQNLVSYQNGTKSEVVEAVKTINPLGMTPLAYSAGMVIDQLRQSETKSTIILITDGIETCDGNICEVVNSAKAEGIDFRLHIVGFGLKEGESEQLKCAAEAGEGLYFEAGDAAALMTGLDEATEITVDKPLHNISFFASKNGQPVDAIVQAYLEGSKGKIKAIRTYQDTAYLYLPPAKYFFEVTALERSDIKPIYTYNVETSDNEMVFQPFSFDGGKFSVTVTNNGEPWDATVNVFEKGNTKAVSGSRTYGKTISFELSKGVYEIDFLAIGIEGLENKTRKSELKVISGEEIPIAVDFKSGTVIIGVSKGVELVDAAVSIDELKTGKNVAGARTYTNVNSNPKKFVLSPGIYKVTVTTLGKDSGKKEVFEMEIVAGDTFQRLIKY